MAVENYNNAAAVTPSNTDLLPNSGMLYIGSVSGGTALKVVTKGGQTVTFTVVAVGLFEGLEVEQVFDTGTTASAIHVFY